jgi:hypothetical protein
VKYIAKKNKPLFVKKKDRAIVNMVFKINQERGCFKLIIGLPER